MKDLPVEIDVCVCNLEELEGMFKALSLQLSARLRKICSERFFAEGKPVYMHRYVRWGNNNVYETARYPKVIEAASLLTKSIRVYEDDQEYSKLTSEGI